MPLVVSNFSEQEPKPLECLTRPSKTGAHPDLPLLLAASHWPPCSFFGLLQGPHPCCSFCLGHFLLDVHRVTLSHSKSLYKHPLPTAAFLTVPLKNDNLCTTLLITVSQFLIPSWRCVIK